MLIMAAVGTPWYLDSKLWVAIPVVLFIAFVMSKGAHKALAQSLDSRSADIKTELDEARRLREEAQALLASFHRKQKEAEAQAEAIVKQARHDAEVMATQARADLKERLERRATLAEAKIATAEAQALSEVKDRAAELAIAASEVLIRDTMKPADHTALIKDGIAQMDEVLN